MYAADIQRALRVMGPRFVQIYGQGETPMVATALVARASSPTRRTRAICERLASVGVAQTPVQLRVADAQTAARCRRARSARCWCAATRVMAGYWRNPEASAAALRDGWLWTGDVGCLDADGFLTLKDRSKDLLISGGSNIYPREVEEVLLTAAGVAEAAVVGAPDPELGRGRRRLRRRPARRAAGRGGARRALPGDTSPASSGPSAIVFVDALPKNNYGKVLKTELRERLCAPLSGTR